VSKSFGGGLIRSREVQCAVKLRSLGSAVQLYSVEHAGQFPRSFHSAGAKREPGWAVSIAPYLTGSDNVENWEGIFNRYYRSPFDEEKNPSIYSYGLNVYFELELGEDYVGSPRSWRTMADVEYPGGTVMMARISPVMFGDHFMSHYWGGLRGAENAVKVEQHDQEANFLYVDGHVERQKVKETFDPEIGLNRWHPMLASGR
jgi:prepilin-type processing-associated H-X9-DG protein